MGVSSACVVDVAICEDPRKYYHDVVITLSLATFLTSGEYKGFLIQDPLGGASTFTGTGVKEKIDTCSIWQI